MTLLLQRIMGAGNGTLDEVFDKFALAQISISKRKNNIYENSSTNKKLTARIRSVHVHCASLIVGDTVALSRLSICCD